MNGWCGDAACAHHATGPAKESCMLTREDFVATFSSVTDITLDIVCGATMRILTA